MFLHYLSVGQGRPFLAADAVLPFKKRSHGRPPTMPPLMFSLSIPLQGGTDDVSADASPTKKRRGRPPSIPPPRVRLAALAALGSLDGGGPPGDSSDEDDNNDGDNKEDDEDYDDEGEGGAATGGGGRPRKVQRTTTPQPVSGSGVAAVPTSAAAAAGAGAGAGRDGTPLPEGFPEGLNPDFLPPEVCEGGGEGGWIVQ